MRRSRKAPSTWNALNVASDHRCSEKAIQTRPHFSGVSIVMTEVGILWPVTEQAESTEIGCMA
jgi:hypothetical protein